MWVYAAKVAIEYTTEQNNFQCGDSPGDWVRSGHSVIMGKMRDCMRNKGEADCEVGSGYPDNNSNYLLQAALPREIQFQFGRADCVSEYEGEWEQYKTDRPETHPNPEVDILIYLQYLPGVPKRLVNFSGL